MMLVCLHDLLIYFNSNICTAIFLLKTDADKQGVPEGTLGSNQDFGQEKLRAHPAPTHGQFIKFLFLF
jgi:hypothetical protein